jgi:hypothetical protein
MAEYFKPKNQNKMEKPKRYRISVSITKAEHIEIKRLSKLRKQTLSKLLIKAFYEYHKN